LGALHICALRGAAPGGTSPRASALFQHAPAEAVGIWLELREDFRGLFARGRLIPEVARGRELISLLRSISGKVPS